jgi:hypothetical protein
MTHRSTDEACGGLRLPERIPTVQFAGVSAFADVAASTMHAHTTRASAEANFMMLTMGDDEGRRRGEGADEPQKGNSSRNGRHMQMTCAVPPHAYVYDEDTECNTVSRSVHFPRGALSMVRFSHRRPPR